MINKYPDAFTSAVLAQKKLLSGGNSNNGSNSLAAPTFNSNIQDKPIFHTPSGSNERNSDDYGLPLSDIINTLSRKAKSLYERYLISEQGRELITKATEYEIPFNIREVNFLELRDKVEEFEEAIEKANEYGVDWKSFGYDLLAIEQEVAELEQAENDYMSYARNEFCLTRGVEV